MDTTGGGELGELGLDLNQTVIEGMKVNFFCGCSGIDTSRNGITLCARGTRSAPVAFEFETFAFSTYNRNTGAYMWATGCSGWRLLRLGLGSGRRPWVLHG